MTQRSGLFVAQVMTGCALALTASCTKFSGALKPPPPKAAVQSSGDDVSAVQVKASYGELPLYFIQNDGQVDEKVKFYEKGSGHATYFAEDGVYVSLARSGRTLTESCQATPTASLARHVEPCVSAPSVDGESLKPAVIKLVAVGGNPHPTVVAERLQEGKVNYFVGNDPERWKSDIPTYQAVRYEELFPGIDVKFYGNNRQLEYDVIVKPGADPGVVKFGYEGVDGLNLTESGDLDVTVAGKTIVQRRPVVYQQIDGQRVDVDGKFKVHENADAGTPRLSSSFEVAEYDRTHELVIDPVLIYSTYLGGTGVEFGAAIAVDSTGNAYVTGQTSSVDFPTGDPAQAILGGSSDVFVTKLNASGTAMVYSTYLGGTDPEDAQGIVVDNAGNAYLAGSTFSTNFPTANPIQPVLRGPFDAFVVKLDPAGSSLVYSSYLGGSQTDQAHRIAVDGAGNAYISGSTGSADFPTVTPYQNALAGPLDAFVVKLNAAGTALLYSTYLGGSNDELGYGITVDADGHAYVTGLTYSADFPVVNPFQVSHAGGPNGEDAFVAKLDTTGSSLIYSTYLGGAGDDAAGSIVVDSAGNAYVTGFTSSSNFPTANPFQPTAGGGYDGFIAKLNATGSALTYSTYLGGTSNEIVMGLAVDAAGNAHVAGWTWSMDFPTANAPLATLNGPSDAFVAKLSAAGSALSYSTYLGGSSNDEGWGIAVDSEGHAFVTGLTFSTDFPISNPVQPSFGGVIDAFVAKFTEENVVGVLLGGSGGGTVSSSPVGITCGQICSAMFDVGTSVTLTAIPDATSTFAGWGGVCIGTGTCVVTMDGSAKAVVATFNAIPQIAPFEVVLGGSGSGVVTSSPPGISCLPTCWMELEVGMVVTLTAVPDSVSTFAGWGDPCTSAGTGTCTLTVTGPVTVAATFSGILAQTAFPFANGPANQRAPAAASDGTNFLMVWEDDRNAPGIWEVYGALVSPGGVRISPTDIRISQARGALPAVAYGGGVYLVGWSAYDSIAGEIVRVARVRADGVVLDPGGVTVGSGSGSTLGMAFDGTNFFLAWRDPNSDLRGTRITTAGAVLDSGGVRLSTSPGAVWPSAAYGNGHFLVVWNTVSPRVVRGVLVDTNGQVVGGEFQIGNGQIDTAYSVAFDGTNFMVAWDQGFFPPTVRLARVSPSGTVLDPAGVPVDAGNGSWFPSIDFDGLHYRVVWSANTATDQRGLRTARVSTAGVVLDPGGLILSVDGETPAALAFGNGKHLVGWTENLGSSGQDIYAALIPGGPVPVATGKLSNISTRARVQTGDNVMIGGFIVGGSVPKTVLIRARGGSLGGAPFNNPGVLANPTMQLYSGQTVIAQNNDWQTTDALCLSPATACGGVPEITATGLDPCQPNPGQTASPPGCGQESALYVTLPPGTYTAIVRGVGGTSGMGLIEVFEADTSAAKLTNISTRARVETGDNVMIGGFIVGGTSAKTVLIRARGGSLGGAPFNNPGVLANPTMQLYSGQTVIAQNNDWQTTDALCLGPATACGGVPEITATGLDPCRPNPGQSAAPPGCSQESALYVTLAPGTYTAIVRGVGGTSGMGLVEVFEVP